MERTYNYPVWGTQGGGLVREINGTYIFVEKPDCPGLDVGDEMSAEWGIIPANSHARDEMEKVEWGPRRSGDVRRGSQASVRHSLRKSRGWRDQL